MPEVQDGALLAMATETAQWLVLQVVVFALTFAVAKRVWPKAKDHWGLADLLISLVIYPVLTWAAIQGSLETGNDVVSRWSATTPVTRFYQVLYVSRSLMHFVIIIMQPSSLLHKVLTAAHHILSIAAYSGSLLSGKCHHFAVLDGCCEITNVFLTFLFLTKEVTIRDKTLGDIIPHWVYISNGAMLWLSFVVFRLVLFPYWLVAFFTDVASSPELSVDTLSLYELCLYPFANVFLLVLSTKWFLAIHQGLVKAACGDRQKDASKPPQKTKSS